MPWWQVLLLLAQPELQVRPATPSAVLTADHEIAVDVVGADLPALVASTGDIGLATRLGPGHHRAQYHLPPAGPPSTAVLIARAAGEAGPLWAAATINLIGVAEIEVETTPGSRVELEAAGQRFEQTVPPSAVARFSVRAEQPRLTYSYRVISPSGSSFRRNATLLSTGVAAVAVGPLPEPWLEPGDTAVFGVAAADSTGVLVPAADLDCRADGGALTRNEAPGPHIARFVLRAPATPDGRLLLECGSAVSGWRQHTVHVGPALPHRLWLGVPGEHVAGSGPLVVTVGVDDADGEPTVARGPTVVEVAGGPPGWSQEIVVDPGQVEAQLDVPGALGGATSLELRARLAHPGLETRAVVPLAPGPPTAVVVDAPAAVTADGRAHSVRARLIDAFGNPLPHDVPVSAHLGKVEGGNYLPPRSTHAAIDRLSARAGDISAERNVELVAATPFEIGVGVGPMLVNGDTWAVATHGRAGVVFGQWYAGASLFAARAAPSASASVDVDQTWTWLAALASLGAGVRAAPWWLRAEVGVGASSARVAVRLAQNGAPAAPERVVWSASEALSARFAGGWTAGAWGVEIGAAVVSAPFTGEVLATLLTVGASYTRW